jgi:hypothetical protein
MSDTSEFLSFQEDGSVLEHVTPGPEAIPEVKFKGVNYDR